MVVRCETCKKYFADASVLRDHTRIHTGERPFVCAICLAASHTRCNLTKHVKRHQGIVPKPYRCGLCCTTYESRKTITNHLRLHSHTVYLRNYGPERVHKCDACGQCFTNPSGLKLHAGSHTKPFKCELCPKSFTLKATLQQHCIITHSVKSQGLSPIFDCCVCMKRFVGRAALAQHLCSHSGAKPFVCELCNEGFRSLYLFRIHRQKCTRSVSTVAKLRTCYCAMCAKSCYNKVGLAKHLQTHVTWPQRRAFICTNCGAMLMSRDALRWHQKRHITIKPFRCLSCSAAFKTVSELAVHQRNVHLTLGKPYRCGKCPAEFASIQNYKKHSLTHSDDRPFSCDICTRQFKTVGTLTSHRRRFHVRNRAKLFSCDQCHAAFYDASKLQRHRSTVHSREKPYQCSSCRKSFKSRDSLRGHENRHCGGAAVPTPQFLCHLCGQGCFGKSTLERHICQVHTGNKPFTCAPCGAAFNVKMNLARHVSTSHTTARNPHSCARCGKRFTNKAAVPKHLARIHL